MIIQMRPVSPFEILERDFPDCPIRFLPTTRISALLDAKLCYLLHLPCGYWLRVQNRYTASLAEQAGVGK